MPCPFCNNKLSSRTIYPVNRFNSRDFRYVRCINCKLIYLDPFPNNQDYEAMYPPSYQDNKVETWILEDTYKKLPGLRFSYGYQFDLIKKKIGEKARILDYGCGNGHFIANAIHCGFSCDGAEFNPGYVALLQSKINAAKFYTIDQILNEGVTVKYDVIRMSNVLEHLTEPAKVLNKIKSNLNPGGIVLVEGPIEENFCLSILFRKFYFRIKKALKPHRVISSPPYHIFLSNRKNQRNFFRECGLIETHFFISEDAWPFPVSLREAKGFAKKSMTIVAIISLGFTKLFNKNWGNVFIYAGTDNYNETVGLQV